jgi:hypothetical protein
VAIYLACMCVMMRAEVFTWVNRQSLALLANSQILIEQGRDRSVCCTRGRVVWCRGIRMYAGAGASRFLLWPVVGEGDGILTLGQDGMGSLILNKWKHGVGAPDEDLHILTQAPIMYG